MDTQKENFSRLIKIHKDGVFGHLSVNDKDLSIALESVNSALNETYDSVEELLDIVELYLEDASVKYSWILPEVEVIDVGTTEKHDRGEDYYA